MVKWYRTEVGSLLVVSLPSVIREYIAQVTSCDPLLMKIEETGPYSKIKGYEVIIHEEKTVVLQGEDQDAWNAILRESKERGHAIVSGLKVLGVEDGKLREMLPTDFVLEATTPNPD